MTIITLSSDIDDGRQLIRVKPGIGLKCNECLCEAARTAAC